MGKILIFYKYIDIKDPHGIVREQRALCEKLALKGRILLAHEGINGTLGGSDDATKQFKEYMLSHALFSDVDIKESSGESDHFPKLKIMVKKEIVCLRLDRESAHPKDAGDYLTPNQAHALIEQNPEDLMVFDARNNYESRVGAFVNAVTPDIDHFRDLPAYIDNNLAQFKDKKVVMYCTAGICCERATAYLKTKNIAKEIYHIKGGIQRYVESFPDGFFRGKNYVFDGRVTHPVTNDVLASCEHCKKAYDDYSNCINAECNKQIVVCPPCMEVYHNTCSQKCLELVQALKVNVRTIPHKILIRSQQT